MKESLLCPNQKQAAGMIIEDHTMKQFKAFYLHSITFPETKLEIPLHMHGVTLYLNTRLPLAEELEHYLASPFQSVELMEDEPCEPYFTINVSSYTIKPLS
jgi:hypothetical protein